MLLDSRKRRDVSSARGAVKIASLGMLLALCWLSGAARGEALRLKLQKLNAELTGHRRECEDDQVRAGCPGETSILARPTDSCAYDGYWVGGGAAVAYASDLPGPDEGTWGWDYFGALFKRRVALRWWHGRRYQGGTGRYRTDGPKAKHLFHHEREGSCEAPAR